MTEVKNDGSIQISKFLLKDSDENGKSIKKNYNLICFHNQTRRFYLNDLDHQLIDVYDEQFKYIRQVEMESKKVQ